ncbi:MAG TPA: SUMF1/EgtB/PvdO family nonheme iron enzyme [bacterium]|jgi:formylglycine-generating enzyme required for sulfatase activity
MPNSLFALLCALLLVAHGARCEGEPRGLLRAPAIAGVEALSGESALVWWTSVDGAITRVQVLVNEHSWGGYEPRTECSADRGWIVVNGLQPHRHYRLALSSTDAADSSLPGPAFDYTHNPPLVNWVFVPGGDFEMGDSLDTEAGRHPVNLPSYMLSAAEVTNREYLAYCMLDSVPPPEDPGFTHLREYVRHYPEYPVLNVTWGNAAGYCNFLSRRMGLRPCYDSSGALLPENGVRLPTEAEWERAAGLAGVYPWGDTAPTADRAAFAPGKEDTFRTLAGPRPVESYPASPSGFYDLAGNVWEWCNDWYAPYFEHAMADTNPRGPTSGIYKVLRGGSWADSAATMRAANRARLTPDVTMSTVGFRVARSFSVSSPTVLNATHAEEHNALAK